MITWWQRIAVVLDLALLWALWPGIVRSAAVQTVERKVRHRVAVSIAAFASVIAVLLVFIIATFPGECLDDLHFPAVPLLPQDGGWVSVKGLLVAGPVDMAARKPASLWSNRLVVSGIDIIDHAKFDTESKIFALPETVSLRARHLEGAVLIGAGLRKADFTSANLQDATMAQICVVRSSDALRRLRIS